MPHFEVSIQSPIEFPKSVLDLSPLLDIKIPLGLVNVIACKKFYHDYEFEEHSAPSLWGEYDHSVVKEFEFDLFCTDCSKVIGSVDCEIKNYKIDLSKTPHGCTVVDSEDDSICSSADFILPGQCTPCSLKVYNSAGEEISDTESEPSYENGRI